nr:hypothetical protein [Streptomyces sp. 846.5]
MQAVSTIESALRAELISLGDVTGVSSLAAGADQLCAATVLELGGSLEVIVPSDHYESTMSGSPLDEYRRLLATAGRVRVLPFSEPSEEAFFAAGKEIVGICDQMIAVWDGKPAKGLGGTADVVRYAEELGVPVRVIWPEGLVR